MLAQRALDARGRVFLERRGQQPMLRLDLPFERGWASLDAALPKAGFVVDDRNREARQFWVHYAPAEIAADDGEDEGDKRGWFSRGGLEAQVMQTGDALIVPTQLDFETWGRAFVRNLKDFAQIFTGFGIGIAAINSL